MLFKVYDDAPHGLVISREANLDGCTTVIEDDDILPRPHRDDDDDDDDDDEPTCERCSESAPRENNESSE